MEFRSPYLLILIPIVLGLMWFFYRRQKNSSFQFSSLTVLKDIAPTWKTRFNFVSFALRVAAVLLVCVALAGPRKVLEESKVSTNGIDIVLALDCSGSMAAEDFKVNGKRVNRFDIIKKVVAEFIEGRKSDQISLVGFAGRAYTICPLTTDHTWVLSNLERMRLGIIEDGTAIGSGLMSSLSRFKDSKAKSKVVILLTDGINNAGNVDPVTAANTAKGMGVKVYTIGAGTKGLVPYPVSDLFGNKLYQNVQSDLDEETLSNIAQLTNARFFRAVDTEALREVYKEIDRLEKTKIEQIGYKQYQELFPILVIIALVLLFTELILINTVFLKIP